MVLFSIANKIVKIVSNYIAEYGTELLNIVFAKYNNFFLVLHTSNDYLKMKQSNIQDSILIIFIQDISMHHKRKLVLKRRKYIPVLR